MTDPIAPVLRAYEEGHAALLLTGRSLYDLVVAEEGCIRPALEVLRRALRARHGIHLITYSLAAGVDWDASRLDDARDRSTIEQALRVHGLIGDRIDHREVERVLRGVSALTRAPRGSLQWADGTELRFGILLEFAEHLVPISAAGPSDAEVVAIELAHLTGQSLALRASGNLVMFHGRESQVDDLVRSALYRVCLGQPDEAEKRQFIDACRRLYAQGTFEGIADDLVARLTVNTPNRGLEELLRASHRTQQPIPLPALTRQKSADVETLSDRSLVVLDPARVDGVRLEGRNVATPVAVLQRFGTLLREGSTRMPANVLLAGAPGSGKTDLAILAAQAAGVTAYELRTPKRGIVGQTEAVATAQWELLKAWSPAVAFVDEVTEALPLERSDFDGDSGASRAVTAALLTALSDDSRRGRSLLICSTNCPWRMGAAMRSRFIVVPVLHPLREDLPTIVMAIVARLQPHAGFGPGDPLIVEAADVFNRKGATARDIRQALTNAAADGGELTAERVLWAANDLTGPSVDAASRMYADLWAVRACGSRSFLPWAEAPATYPYPPHLRGIVDPHTGDVDADALERRLTELKPHANV